LMLNHWSAKCSLSVPKVVKITQEQILTVRSVYIS
jgi:hypothetical protein